ncbi:acyltransferase family protein [Methanoregula sp.]|uniref:acyltransferase family protein n=1 Tax=Methanoregula sp. TaxID=2052170 RepID=UPI003BB04710
MSTNRVLMFDVLRILAILLIVVAHVGQTLKIPPLLQSFGISPLSGGIGEWGIVIFLLISGCVLEYNYGKKVWDAGTKFDYIQFIEKRLLRIYPAFWFSMLLAVILTTYVLTSANVLRDLILPLTGFYFFLTKLGSPAPPINGVTWFVGTIVCLYLMYPLLSRILKRNGVQGLIAILLVAGSIRIILNAEDPTAWYWFPLSRMAEFALGIYIIQAGYYLKTINTSKIIAFASDFSFPVFLTHYIAIPLLIELPFAHYMNIIGFIAVALFLALLVYIFDINFKEVYESFRIWLKTRGENTVRT